MDDGWPSEEGPPTLGEKEKKKITFVFIVCPYSLVMVYFELHF